MPIGVEPMLRLGGWLPKRYLLSSIYLARAAAIALFLVLPLTPMSVYVFSAAMGVLWLSTVPSTVESEASK